MGGQLPERDSPALQGLVKETNATEFWKLTPIAVIDGWPDTKESLVAECGWRSLWEAL